MRVITSFCWRQSREGDVEAHDHFFPITSTCSERYRYSIWADLLTAYCFGPKYPSLRPSYVGPRTCPTPTCSCSSSIPKEWKMNNIQAHSSARLSDSSVLADLDLLRDRCHYDTRLTLEKECHQWWQLSDLRNRVSIRAIKSQKAFQSQTFILKWEFASFQNHQSL